MFFNLDWFFINDRGYGIQIGYVFFGFFFLEKDVCNVVNGFYKLCIEKKVFVVVLVFDGQYYSFLNNFND